jgi:hypothetical protein
MENRPIVENVDAPSSSALAILNRAAESHQPDKLTLLGVCSNVLVTIHEKECTPCAQYAQHVHREFPIAASFHGISTEVAKKAIKTAFPNLIDDERVEEIHQYWKEEEERNGALKSENDSLKGRIEDLKKDLRDAKHVRDGEAQTRYHWEESYHELRAEYVKLRGIVSRALPALPLPPNPLEDRRPRSSTSKRARESSEEPGPSRGDRPESPHKGKRARRERDNAPAEDIDMNVDEGDSAPAMAQGQSTASLAEIRRRYEGGTDEEEEIYDPSKPPIPTPVAIFERELPAEYQWILTSTLEESRFRQLLSDAWKATNVAKSQGERADLPVHYRAVKWRNRQLLNEKRKGVRRIILPGNMTEFPPKVQTILREWSHNPSAIFPCIRERPDGTLSLTDVDIAAWVRAIKPAERTFVREFKELLAAAFTRFDDHEPQLNWSKAAPVLSPWLCIRAGPRFSWCPGIKEEEILQWLIEHAGLTREDGKTCRDWFLRANSEEWYNTPGRLANEPSRNQKRRKAKGKPVLAPYLHDGAVKTPEEASQLATLAHGPVQVPINPLRRLASRITDAEDTPLNYGPPEGPSGSGGGPIAGTSLLARVAIPLQDRVSVHDPDSMELDCSPDTVVPPSSPPLSPERAPRSRSRSRTPMLDLYE